MNLRGFWAEFRQFIDRGNVLDLAIGVVIGAAFGKIVSSFVADIFTPILGLLVGGIDFSKLQVVIGWDPDNPAIIKYGVFIQAVFDFLIIAFAIFLLIRAFNALQRKKQETPAVPPPPSPEVQLLTEIRDLLRSKQ
ncbi:MAG: large-conductance mechanosensitive channel protein MscL [Thermostichales cyanobacterium BF4_bins_65]